MEHVKDERQHALLISQDLLKANERLRTVLSASMHENSKTKKALSFVFNHQNDMTTNGPDNGMTTNGSDDGMTSSGSDDGMTTGDSDSDATTGGPDDGSPENSTAGQTAPGNAPAQTDSNAPAQTDSNDETTSAPTARFASAHPHGAPESRSSRLRKFF